MGMLHRYLLIAVSCLFVNVTHAEMVTLKTAYGTTFNAYVAGSADAEAGVVLAHDRWGVSPAAKAWADRFSAHGYRVVVADFYDGRRVHRESLAKMAMAQTDPEWVRANLYGALDHLSKHQRKIAVVGWGYGAKYLYQIAAKHDANIDALITFDALPNGKQIALEEIDVPMLSIFGRHDRRLTFEKIDDFEMLMLRLRKNLDVVSVNAGAGFVNPLNSTYQLAASNEAWFAIEAFLTRHFADER